MYDRRYHVQAEEEFDIHEAVTTGVCEQHHSYITHHALLPGRIHCGRIYHRHFHVLGILGLQLVARLCACALCSCILRLCTPRKHLYMSLLCCIRAHTWCVAEHDITGATREFLRKGNSAHIQHLMIACYSMNTSMPLSCYEHLSLNCHNTSTSGRFGILRTALVPLPSV